MYYRSGLRDLPSFFFYTIAWITAHCILQEYLLDKIQRRLHLSKTRMSKFNESGHLFAFCAYSAAHAGYILHEMGMHKDVTQFWVGYPDVHRYLPLTVKIFFILQVIEERVYECLDYLLDPPIPGILLHEGQARGNPSTDVLLHRFLVVDHRRLLCIVGISSIRHCPVFRFNRLALVLLFLEYSSQTIFHFTRVLYFTGKIKNAGSGFKLWNAVFVIVRFASVVLSVLTLWYGFKKSNHDWVSLRKLLVAKF